MCENTPSLKGPGLQGLDFSKKIIRIGSAGRHGEECREGLQGDGLDNHFSSSSIADYTLGPVQVDEVAYYRNY